MKFESMLPSARSGFKNWRERVNNRRLKIPLIDNLDLRRPEQLIAARLKKLSSRVSEKAGKIYSTFADDFLAAATAQRKSPDAPIDLPLPKGENGSIIVRCLVGEGDSSVYSLQQELPKGANRQLTHPIPGVDLFVIITQYPPNSTERRSSFDLPPEIRVDRRVVNRHNLPESVRNSFDKSD